MTSDINILNMTTNGIVSKKRHFNEYQIQFKELNFSFSLEAYDEFTQYIIELKNIFEEHFASADCFYQEISIPTANETLKFQLSYKDLAELSDLFAIKSMRINIMNHLDYSFSLN